jgi:hypothetical protein
MTIVRCHYISAESLYHLMNSTIPVDNAAREWLYLDNTGQKGPVPASILLRLLEKGIGVHPGTMVWKAGMDAWQPIAQVSI